MGVRALVHEAFVLGVGLVGVAVECGCFAAVSSVILILLPTAVGRVAIPLRVVAVVVGHFG